MLSIPEVMPVPSNVIVELPSIVTGGFVDPMNMVDVTAMVCGPEPQLNVTVPPAEICACSAACVQELGVPLPTTPPKAVVDRTVATAATTSTRELKTEKQRKVETPN